MRQTGINVILFSGIAKDGDTVVGITSGGGRS